MKGTIDTTCKHLFFSNPKYSYGPHKAQHTHTDHSAYRLNNKGIVSNN